MKKNFVPYVLAGRYFQGFILTAWEISAARLILKSSIGTVPGAMQQLLLKFSGKCLKMTGKNSLKKVYSGIQKNNACHQMFQKKISAVYLVHQVFIISTMKKEKSFI